MDEIPYNNNVSNFLREIEQGINEANQLIKDMEEESSGLSKTLPKRTKTKRPKSKS